MGDCEKTSQTAFHTRHLLDRLGDQWTVLIIRALSDGPQRYTDLGKRIEEISQKMLTQTLRSLERDGLVTRTVHPVVPSHVEYQLTELGRELLIPISALERWALLHTPDVHAARDKYDHRSKDT